MVNPWHWLAWWRPGPVREPFAVRRSPLARGPGPPHQSRAFAAPVNEEPTDGSLVRVTPQARDRDVG